VFQKADEEGVIKATSYMYAFLLVPTDADVRPVFVCGLLSTQGIGDKRVMEVIEKIKSEA
jgi:hypothetical protein